MREDHAQQTGLNPHRNAAASPLPSVASFQWSDPFLLDDQFTEDERLGRAISEIQAFA